MNHHNKYGRLYLNSISAQYLLSIRSISITVDQLYWLAQVANDLCISTVLQPELGEILTPNNNHIGRRDIEFTYSQVTTSECIHVWNK